MYKIHNKSKSAGISIPTDLLLKIDKDRGDISRSRYIVRIIERVYFNKDEISPNYTDLVITECPINCDTCQQIWKNEVFCIKIICECKKCNHKKNIVLDEPCKPSNTHCRNHILNLTAEADDQI